MMVYLSGFWCYAARSAFPCKPINLRRVLRGAQPERPWLWESYWAWLSVYGNCCRALCALLLGPWGWAAWFVYPLRCSPATDHKSGTLATLSLFEVHARFQVFGQMRFFANRLPNEQVQLIKHK
jgi:hypothetical protein